MTKVLTETNLFNNSIFSEVTVKKEKIMCRMYFFKSHIPNRDTTFLSLSHQLL